MFISRLFSLLLILLISFLGSIDVSALEDGETANYKVDDSHNNTAGFVIFEVGGYKGSCAQKGTPYKNSGKAVISKKSNSSDLAKAAYYVDIVKGWYGNSKDRPAIMDKTGVASRFRAGLLAEDIVQCANQGKDKWSEIALRQTYPKAYVDYVCSTVSEIISGKAAPDNFVLFKGQPSDGSQDFAVWGYVPSGYLTLTKAPAETATDFIAEAPNNYSLEGAEYELFKADGSRASDTSGKPVTLKTKADGTTQTAEVAAGDYYAVETVAPKGFLKDSGKYSVTVKDKNTASDPAKIKCTDTPTWKGLPVLEKESKTGEVGWRKLLGAEYTLMYYDTDPMKTDVSGLKPARRWVFMTREGTNSQGKKAAIIDFNKDEPLGGSDKFYMENGKRLMPCGVYTVEETKAPAGMVRNTTVYYGSIRQPSNGAAAAAYINTNAAEDMIINTGTDQEVVNQENIQGIVITIQKKDKETGKTSAQKSDRKHSSGSFAGAVFNIYLDSEDKPSPELIGTVTTDKAGTASISKREKGDENYIGLDLVPGTYLIEEVQAPPGYALDKLNAGDQPGKYEDGKHVLRARASEGGAASCKYTVQSIEAPHHTLVSKTDITSGAELPGAKLQVLDSAGNIIEEWISSDKPHDIVALHDETQGLRDGKYILREITAPYGYDTAEDVRFEVKSGKLTNTVKMQNKPVEISTNSVSAASGTHHGLLSETEIIKDSVKIKGLYAGRKYKVSGKLVDKSTGEALKGPDGKDASAEKVFTAKGDEEETVLEFRVDTSDFTPDMSAVGFEKLYRLKDGGGSTPGNDEEGQSSSATEIAKHEDLDSPGQTVCYGSIIATRATDSKGESKRINPKRTAVVKDHVDYQGLSVMENYTLEAELYDKTEGRLTGITAALDFTPESPDGTAEVTFNFDARGFEGHSLVAFEALKINGMLICDHRDPDDADQTVFINERVIPDTGERGILLAWVTLTTLTAFALVLLILKGYAESRKTDIF